MSRTRIITPCEDINIRIFILPFNAHNNRSHIPNGCACNIGDLVCATMPSQIRYRWLSNDFHGKLGSAHEEPEVSHVEFLSVM